MYVIYIIYIYMYLKNLSWCIKSTTVGTASFFELFFSCLKQVCVQSLYINYLTVSWKPRCQIFLNVLV